MPKKSKPAATGKNKDAIVNATLTSVWDDHETTVESPCTVHVPTRHILSVDMAHREVCSANDDVNADNVDDMVGVLDREYVEIDGKEYPACHKDDLAPGDTTTFWYD